METTNKIVLIAMFITMFAFFWNIIKRFDDVNKRIINLEIEMKTGFEKLNFKIERVDAKLDAKFDLFDNKITNINKQIEQAKETQIEQTAITNTRIDKIDAELKEQRTEGNKFFNKVLNLFKDTPKAAII